MYANAQHFSVQSSRVNEFTSSLLLEYETYDLNVFAVLLKTERNNREKTQNDNGEEEEEDDEEKCDSTNSELIKQ